MSPIHVELGARSYSVFVEATLPAAAVGEIANRFEPGKVVVITDSNVGPLYLSGVVKALESVGMDVLQLEVPAGEASKAWGLAGELLEQIIAFQSDRTRPIIGLGGGVVGDLSGFIASIYLRGVPCVHIATSLLSQVDSSVGGKTGLNHSNTKNLVGSFHQPTLVYCPVKALQTLEAKQIRSGLAEMLKAGFLRDTTLVDAINGHANDFKTVLPEALVPLISRSIAIKARIVEKDEREGGIRALLNLGHSFGHALESAQGLGQLTHGEAVAVGMVAAAHVSIGENLCPRSLLEKIKKTLSFHDLPVVPPSSLSGWKTAFQRDKKSRGTTIVFVGLKDIGEPELITLDIEKAIFWIEEGFFG